MKSSSFLLNGHNPRHFLRVPAPARPALIVKMRGRTEEGGQLLFGETYKPEDALHSHLVFALKYQGVDLHVLKALFVTVGEQSITAIVQREPSGQYARRIWFLYEWLTGTTLGLDDTSSRDYFDLLNPKLQYPGPTRKSRRHGIRDNLPAP